MKLLITGAGGMLARAMIEHGRAHGDLVIALGREALDVTDEAAVATRIAVERPDAVIQCAAYTSVDGAESDGEAAFDVNARGSRSVARACQKIGCAFVYPSTDYVFDGKSTRPYLPGDATNPVNVYGRSKLEGEIAACEADRALVVRTSWLYGAGGAHFVDTMVRLAAGRSSLDVVDDQVGRPTWTRTLAETIHTLLKAGAVGTFHASDGGEPVSWAGYAREIMRELGMDVDIRPVPSSAFPRPAPRPRYSVLELSDTEAMIARAVPDWRESLARFLREG